MTVQLTAALQQELNNLAAERGLSADELALRALASFVADQRDFDAAIARSNADIAAGRVSEHDEVVARIDRLLSIQ